MRSALTQDLASWEQGVLSAAELELRHPRRVGGLVALYDRLSELADGPVPDAEDEWDRLRERLPEHPAAVAVPASGSPFRLRRLVARPLAVAASLVLFGAGIGYAVAPEAVNRQLASVWESVKDFFGDEPSEDGLMRLVEVEQPSVERSDSVYVEPSDSVYKDERDLSGHRSGNDGDRREGGRDDERNGSDEGSGRRSDTGSDDDSGGSSNVASGTSDISGRTTDISDGGSRSGSDSSGGTTDATSGGSGTTDGTSGGSGGTDGSGGDDDGDDGDDDGDDNGSGGDDGGDG